MVFALIPAAITTIFGSIIGPIVEFTSTGIGAGSIAAFRQSVIGSAAGGSIFSTLQSAGATGLRSIVDGICGAVYGIFK